MSYYLKHMFDQQKKWKRKKMTVLICGRCAEIDRAEKVETEGKCPFCGYEYSGGCEQ